MNQPVVNRNSFKDYYDNLPNGIKDQLKRLIMEELEYSYPSFYRKLNNNSWSPKQREKIKKIITSVKYKDPLKILASSEFN